MRTKEKARRRVTTGRSLECPEVCDPLKGMHSSHIVTPGNRQRDMNGGGICLPSVGGKAFGCQSVVNTQGAQSLQRVLSKESLLNCCADMQQSRAFKRKASQFYDLPEAKLKKPQKTSSTPVCSYRSHSSQRTCDDHSQAYTAGVPKKLCMQNDLYLFSFL